MSFELEWTEAAQILAGLDGRNVWFGSDWERPAAELKQSLEIYAGNNSCEPIPIDTSYAPIAMSALCAHVRAQLPPFSGSDHIPPEQRPLVDGANKTLAKIASALTAKSKPV